jgi:hypothetical protein
MSYNVLADGVTPQIAAGSPILEIRPLSAFLNDMQDEDRRMK